MQMLVLFAICPPSCGVSMSLSPMWCTNVSHSCGVSMFLPCSRLISFMWCKYVSVFHVVQVCFCPPCGVSMFRFCFMWCKNLSVLNNACGASLFLFTFMWCQYVSLVQVIQVCVCPAVCGARNVLLLHVVQICLESLDCSVSFGGSMFLSCSLAPQPQAEAEQKEFQAHLMIKRLHPFISLRNDLFCVLCMCFSAFSSSFSTFSS